ncbi:transcriptional regulator, TetR family [Propionispora hippei DSM 15287]|uniref:Transcriptional regulator, TetR family n=2 Tax=Propionispora TaxID=112902 RepID=A0A1M6E108_9FIRM|nr:transcriptional regulator, TetR family [Propionispora hippei DSM 15287]
MPRTPQDPKIRIDEILDTAEPLFAANGYRQTTVQDITNQMGVAKGMIYYYFNSKEAILEAVINRQISILLTDMKNMACSQLIPPPQKIEFMINSIYHTAKYKNGLLLDFLSDEKHLDIRNKIVHQNALLLKPWLLKVIDEGVLKGCFQVSDPLIALNFIMSILHCITDALCEKTSDEQMACHFKIAGSLIEKILALPEATLHLSLK